MRVVVVVAESLVFFSRVATELSVKGNQTTAFPFLQLCGFPHLEPVRIHGKNEKESPASTSWQACAKCKTLEMSPL